MILVKVLLKGERNVGKSMLFKRLQGQPFSEAYIPSTAISTAHIHWNYKVSDDNVVVEVWDVVDKGKLNGITKYDDAVLDGDEDDDQPTPEQLQMKALALAKSEYEVEQLKKSNSPVVNPTNTDHQLAVIDANIVDVYKHCNAVLLVFDITKPWTWDYVKVEILTKVPQGVEVAVLANCKDLESKRVVSQTEVAEFCDKRGISVIECSSLNCYGLKQLYTWLNIPFLKMKINITKQQLVLLEEELTFGKEEVDLNLRASSYTDYVQMLKETKKKTTSGFTEELVNRKTAVRKSLPPQQHQQPNSPSTNMPPTSTTNVQREQEPPRPKPGVPQPQQQPKPQPQQVQPQVSSPQPKSSGFFSAALSYFGASNTPKTEPPKAQPQQKIQIPSVPSGKTDLNSFYAGDTEDAFYSDEGENYASTNVTTNRSVDEDDSPTQQKKKTKKSSKKSSKKPKKVESEDEEEENEEEEEDFDRPMTDQSVNESMDQLYVPMSKQSFTKAPSVVNKQSSTSPVTQPPKPTIVQTPKELPTLSEKEIAEDDGGFYSDEETKPTSVPTKDENLDSFYSDEESAPVAPTQIEDDAQEAELEMQKSPVKVEQPKLTSIISPPVEQKEESSKQPIFAFAERSYGDEEEEKPKKKAAKKSTKKKTSTTEGSSEKPKKKVTKKKKAQEAQEEPSTQTFAPTGYEEL